MEKLENILNKAVDWVNYTPGCWILYTTSTPQIWAARLKNYNQSGNRMLIIAINPKVRAGWLPKWVWEWLRKDRSAKVSQQS